MNKKTRARRVQTIRETFYKEAEELGVSPTQLAGNDI